MSKNYNVKRQYLVSYRNINYVVRLIKNQFWRWSMDYSPSKIKDYPKFSYKSNALTHRGAIKEMNKDIDETLRNMKKAGYEL